MRAIEFITEDIEDLIRYHTKRLTNDPKFQKWFEGSKVKNKDGSPLLCFHGTNVTFDNFRPFSHFGTMAAAHDILKLKGNKSPHQVRLVFLSIKNPELIEDDENIEHSSLVFLMLYTFNISLWTEVRDLLPKEYTRKISVGAFNHEQIINLLKNRKNKGHRLVQRYGKILDLLINLNKEPGSFTIDKFLRLAGAGDENQETAILKKMKEQNIDGFYYKNKFEDLGSTSWVITSPKQVWSIFK